MAEDGLEVQRPRAGSTSNFSRLRTARWSRFWLLFVVHAPARSAASGAWSRSSKACLRLAARRASKLSTMMSAFSWRAARARRGGRPADLLGRPVAVVAGLGRHRLAAADPVGGADGALARAAGALLLPGLLAAAARPASCSSPPTVPRAAVDLLHLRDLVEEVRVRLGARRRRRRARCSRPSSSRD